MASEIDSKSKSFSIYEQPQIFTSTNEQPIVAYMLHNLFNATISVWLLLYWLNGMHYSLNFLPSQKVISLDISG